MAHPGAPLVGVEHEFYLRYRQHRVDFRRLIDHIELPGRRIDPYDPLAHRLTNGHMITADDAEAEYATAPIPIEPGFLDEVVHACGVAGSALRKSMPRHIGLVGASTHVSVSCPDLYAKRICEMITAHFAPAVMLLAEDERSFGLLIRPRYGRIEFGLDYVSGKELRSLVAMCVAIVLFCVEILDGDAEETLLPSRLEPRWETANRRPGYYVQRNSMGGDLYRGGRATLLRRPSDGPVEAGEHLQHVWKAVRPSLARTTEPFEFDAVDDVVAGSRPLPMERGKKLAIVRSHRKPAPNPYAAAMQTVTRPSFTAEVVTLSWDLAVFAIAGRRRVYAVVPRDDLSRFCGDLADGDLDQWVEAYIAQDPSGRKVPSYPEAVAATALYDTPSAPLRLATPDRTLDDRLWLEDGSPLDSPRLLPRHPTVWASDVDPASAGELKSVTRPPDVTSVSEVDTVDSFDQTETKPPKPPDPDEGPFVTPPTSRPPWIWIATIIALIILILVVATRGGDSGEPPTSTDPTGTEPTDSTSAEEAGSTDTTPTVTAPPATGPTSTTVQQAACNVAGDSPPSPDTEAIAAAAGDVVAQARLAGEITYTGYALGSHIFTMGVAGDGETVSTLPSTRWYNPRFVVNHDEFNVPLNEEAFTVDVGFSNEGILAATILDANFGQVPDVEATGAWLDASTLQVTVSGAAIDGVEVTQLRIELVARIGEPDGPTLADVEGNGCWSPG